MVQFNDADEFFETVAEGGGTAYRFKDIEGIGPKTAQKLKSVPGVNGPQDVTDYTADDLAEEAGISRSRAAKAIQGGGGNPSRDKRNRSGSVSAGNLANQMEESQQQAAGLVQERQSVFEQLVETGEEVPDRRQVRLAAQRVLEEREGIDFDEASSETRGSASNPPQLESVGSAFGPSMLTVGDFEVPSDEQEQAREAYAERSPEAKQVDSRRRAPITTDASRYARRPGKLDFPGIDTPTESPGVRPKDYKRGGGFETREFDDEESQDTPDREPAGEAARQVPDIVGVAPGAAPSDFEEDEELPAFDSEAKRMGADPSFASLSKDARDRLGTGEPPQEALQEQGEESPVLFRRSPNELPGGYRQTETEQFGNGGRIVRYERETDIPTAGSEFIDVQEINGNFELLGGVTDESAGEPKERNPVTTVKTPNELSGVFEAASTYARDDESEDEPPTDPFVGFSGTLASEKDREDSEFRGPKRA